MALEEVFSWGCCSCWGWRMTGRRRSKGGELLLKCCGAPFRPAAERWCRRAGLDGRIGGHAVEQLLPLQSLRGDEQPALHADPVAVHPLPAGGGYLHIDAGDAPPGVVVAGAGDLLRVRVQHGLIGGDVLSQIGGAALRRGGEVVGGPSYQ